MLYIEQSLGPNEELVFVGRFHWMYTVHALFSMFFMVLASVMALMAGVYAYIQLGKFPPHVDWIMAVPYTHPGLRIFSFLLFILGLFSFANKMVVKATTEIAVTNQRLVYKRGLIARQVGEINIDRIEGVNVLQSVLGRIFDYGRLAIRGMGVGEVVLPPVENPIVFRQSIEKAKVFSNE